MTERQCTCVTFMFLTYNIIHAKLTKVIIVMHLEILLLSHATIIQQNMVDSEFTSINDSSYWPKGMHTEKEQCQLL